MAISVSFQVRKDVLCVTASGRDDHLESVLRYGQSIIEKARETGLLKVLCDERDLVYDLDVLGTFDSAEYVAKQAMGAKRLAIVCHSDHAKMASVWETIAVNRGLPVRLFNDIRSAEQWMGLSSGSTKRCRFCTEF